MTGPFKWDLVNASKGNGFSSSISRTLKTHEIITAHKIWSRLDVPEKAAYLANCSQGVGATWTETAPERSGERRPDGGSNLAGEWVLRQSLCFKTWRRNWKLEGGELNAATALRKMKLVVERTLIRAEADALNATTAHEEKTNVRRVLRETVHEGDGEGGW